MGALLLVLHKAPSSARLGGLEGCGCTQLHSVQLLPKVTPQPKRRKS